MTQKRILNRIVPLVIVLALSLSAWAVSRTYSKYVTESDGGRQFVTSPAFYFTSDLLVAGGKSYSLNPGTTEVSFSLRNYADLLRFSDDEISYTVSVAGDGGSLSETAGTLSGGNVASQTITLSGLSDGGTYTVTVTGKAGFSQTLSATFTVLEDRAAAYWNVDASNDAYVLLTVWTENASGNVTVTIPTGLIPDNTCQGLEAVKTGDASFTDPTSLDADSSRVYRFFKTNDYSTANTFGVTVGSTTATEAPLG
ncbi:MAG: hypothetical protein IJW29_04055 [Clostridia bacterium]|nr:hypothetical protein [Clostridia bacterium]